MISSNRFTALTAACAWVFAFLVVTTWQALDALPALMADSSALSITLGLRYVGTPLGTQVGFFILALLLVHLAWAVLLWLLTGLTELAFPGWRAFSGRIFFYWFALTALVLLATNAARFPWSKTGLPGFGWALFALQALLMVSIVVIAVQTVRSSPKWKARAPRVAIYSLLALAIWSAASFAIAERSRAHAENYDGPPNIILIGIDSLRPDVIGGSRQIGVTPNIDLFLRDAHEFSHCVTPLARTSPAWMSILSGKYPISSGARENLLPRLKLDIEQTLPEIFRARGYRTTFGIDETRFANIDESFGFDTVITPTMGAADWVLGTLNDLPLTNLLANTRVARWLFPATHANRAAVHVYEPGTFVNLIDRQLESSGPQFVAIHLTLPHWPYHHAASATEFFDPADDSLYAYLSAVMSADRQFGELMGVLKGKGLLNRSIVVLLSDHGEAVGLGTKDSLLSGMRGLSREDTKGLAVPIWGHGSTVLSPTQYNTVLAVRGYGAAKLPSDHDHHDQLVSLVDVMPTLLELAGVNPASGLDGISLAGILAGTSAVPGGDSRIVFTETGLVAPQQGVALDERMLVEQAAFYRMNAANGRLEFREDMLGKLVANKERAAISKRWTVVQIPGRGYSEGNRYYAFDRVEHFARRFTLTEDLSADPSLQTVVDAFRSRYGNELN